MIALILARSVRRDLLAYELSAPITDDATSSSAADEHGWKLVRHDVFRALAVGAGAQVLSVVSATSALGAAGFTSPSARGSLLTAAVLLYLLSAGVAGYAAVRTLAACHAGGATGSERLVNASWRRVCLRTAALPPGAIALSLAVVNVAVRAAGDAGGAVPMSLFASLFVLVRFLSSP